MPQRIKLIHVPSPHIQGDDSWLDVRPMTVEQFNQNADIVRRAQTPFDPDLTEDERQVQRDALDLEQRELFADVVVSWNWVDDRGDPLPQPASNPNVFLLLTMQELGFVTEAVSKSLVSEKKDNQKLKTSS